MKKKLLTVLLSTALCISVLSGCGSNTETAKTEAESSQAVTDSEEKESTEAASEETSTDASETDDKAAADEVAALIDKIYVQERTETTDEDCKKAKEAWDALTDAQKELVKGENADPDYFGRDTGDAGKDDPLNSDEIGDNEILVVSFGTSFNDSRAEDIGGIEKAIQAAYPEWSVRRAFTAQTIINHVQARDGESIDNMEQALERAVANGVKKLIVQPTHLMHGAEYDEMKAAVEKYATNFESIEISEPLLGEVGEDATTVNDDKKKVAEAVVSAAVEASEYDTLEAADKASTAFVFIGHGTSHTAKVTYSQMQAQMSELGYKNVWVGTVEGEPEETACDKIVEAVHEAGYKNVILRPLMVVAGDHANNDMAGDDDDSWKSVFTASGHFDKIDTQIAGLGRIEAVQQLYVDHISAVTDGASSSAESSESAENSGDKLEDGVYLADFETDSTMFHVNEVSEGKGTLTVKDGKMVLHILMPSKNVLNLFSGTAEDAQKDGAELINPTVEEVTYKDGQKEEVNAFDLPVPTLGEEFDCALIGTKGKWYDHKVKVSNPEAVTEDVSESKSEDVEDGEYTVEVSLEGGTGKASITSPAKLVVADGKMTASIEWSSPNYDYMVLDGTKYEPVNTDGNSVFEIPVAELDKDINVVADTIAMSKPHEIEYVLNFKASSLKKN